MLNSSPLLALMAATAVNAYSIPANVQTLHDSIIAQGSCNDALVSGFYLEQGGTPDWSYCGDHLADDGIIYIQGPSGTLADMDVDCDGNTTYIDGDTRCGNSADTQSQTSFMDTVASYGKGIDDLNPNVHMYVVFGNTGTLSGYQNFNPQSYGVEPLSVIAVVCNGNMYYGIWGDENGDDGGNEALVGEASISMATACFGTSMTGNNGYGGSDVLYIAFTGSAAVPGADGANWDAATSTIFEDSLKSFGDALVANIGGGSGATTTQAAASTSTSTAAAATCTACSWAGHCAGATCATSNDCDGSLTCISGTCGGCTWVGHCACAACNTANDCDGALVCSGGVCASP